MSGIPPVERYTLQDLNQLTSDADAYLNDSPRHRTHHRRAREVTESLNANIQGRYLHQLVSVYGIHKKLARDKKDVVHCYLKNGLLEGISEGFTVVDFHKDFDNIGADESIRQGDMLANLREQSPGRYAVSHLVRLTTLSGHSDDLLLEQTIILRGLSPAFASELFLNEPADIPEDSEMLEAERIAALSSGNASRQIAHIDELLQESDDPLPVLVASARKFRGLRPSDQYGLKRLITSRVAPDLFGCTYQFNDGLPLYFSRNLDGTGSSPTSRESSCEIFVAGLENGPHYHYDKGRQYGKLTEESALYLIGYMMEGSQIDHTALVIPLESLKDLSIVRSEDE